MFPRRRRHPLLALAATLLLGGQALWHCALWVIRTQSRTDVQWCPRGHPVPLWSTWICGLCRAPMESHAWDSCRYCGTRPAWIFCGVCNLAVRRGWLR